MRSGTAGKCACRLWSLSHSGTPRGGTTAVISLDKMAGTYRKVFIDSRWRIAGEHNNFTIELPNDVDTTRTASVYLCSCSFSNTFETIVTGVNDKLYCVATRVNGGGASVAIATLTPGKYTGATLADELQTKLRAAIIDGSYSVTFDAAYGLSLIHTPSPRD